MFLLRPQETIISSTFLLFVAPAVVTDQADVSPVSDPSEKISMSCWGYPHPKTGVTPPARVEPLLPHGEFVNTSCCAVHNQDHGVELALQVLYFLPFEFPPYAAGYFEERVREWVIERVAYLRQWFPAGSGFPEYQAAWLDKAGWPAESR